RCSVELADDEITVSDDGEGMTLAQFENGWMRVGTGAKAVESSSPIFGREITGEKGIGRFSARFLGHTLDLESVAYDPSRDIDTHLTARFNWPLYDASEDIGSIEIPYVLRAADGLSHGTTLVIGELRATTQTVNLRDVRTASLGLVSPLRTLLV